MIQPNSGWSLELLGGGRSFRHKNLVGGSWGACCWRLCWQPSIVALLSLLPVYYKVHLPVCHTFAVTCCLTKDNKAKQQNKTSETRKNSPPPAKLSSFNLGILSQCKKVNNLTQSLFYDNQPQNLSTVQGYESIMYSVQLHFTV